MKVSMSTLHRVFGEDLTDMMTFEQRPEGREEQDMWLKGEYPRQKERQTETFKAECSWHVQ